MQRTEIDGVPVLWEPGPEPLRATLTFGVGARDETFRTIGVTHLVEHLAMGALPRVHYDVNASVDMTVTEFTVCARPEQVTEFLERVCRVLGALPVDRLGKEAGVLAAEGGHYTDPTVEGLLHERFGGRGPGLAVYVGPGYDRLTAEHVLAHAARFFVSGNAVLQLTGPPPPGLTLPLPPGPLIEHEWHEPRTQSGPTVVGAAVPGVGVSLLGRRDPAWAAAMTILAERLEQSARHDHGLSYQVSGEGLQLGGERALLAVTLDAREGQEAAVAGIVWAEVQRLAASGPTAEELSLTYEEIKELHADPRYVPVELAHAAEALLLGIPHHPRHERLARLAEVTPAVVRETVSEALPTAQLVVPYEVDVHLPGVGEGGCARVREDPPGRVFKPPFLAQLLAREARAIRLILMDDGVALRDPDGDVHVVRWPEVVAVERDGAELTVFGANGCQVPIDPDLIAGTDKVVAAVERAVPAALRYERSALTSSG
ncbi:hypothetical protein KOI35_45515 [Actinoplanes bogorensis]|uniref:Insulinase family protein n=1 Tax=Paractinoplanes bogorensis TaxID=1610840 RepID=A0ABS5Z514_9ACTN|nr:hypothetical protein [Actinoplanes bogorensis]MBU2670784.1 hypothetical protein [Actinoplanes bogorensis]